MYPIGIITFLTLVSRARLLNEGLKAKFGSLYAGLELNAWKHNVHYISLFLLRRAVLGLSIAFLRNYLFLQLELYMLTTLACLGFLVTVTPYETTLNNVLEIINELVVIMTIYILHTFSIVTKPGQRFLIGWIYLGLIALIVAVNLVIHFSGIVRSTIRLLKSKLVKRA
jgi:hypothetical protein